MQWLISLIIKPIISSLLKYLTDWVDGIIRDAQTKKKVKEAFENEDKSKAASDLNNIFN